MMMMKLGRIFSRNILPFVSNGMSTFVNNLMPKPSLFELAFYDVTVQHVNHYATENLFESYGRNRKKSLSLDVPSLYPLKKRLFVTYEALLSFGTMPELWGAL